MINKQVGMRAAAFIQFSSKYASIAVQLVITAVLSRLVSPQEFGLISIITVFTAFFQLFADMGLGTAVVQFRDLTEEDFGALFFFSCLMAVVLSALFCGASGPIAAFYGDARLAPLCIAASPSLIFSTLNMVPNGLMLRNRRFDFIGIRLVVATVLSGGVAIAMALAGFGAYSLVAQTVMSTAFVFFWNFMTQPIRHINPHFIVPLRCVFSYSIYQFGFSAINYFSRNLDKLLIGRFLGTAAAGYYDKAYKLTTYPLSSFASIIGSVIQPFMAEHQENPDAIFKCWLKVSKILSLVGVIIAAVFFSASSEIVELFYGPGWDESIPVFAILSITVYLQIMCNPTGGFFQSLGRTDLMFRSGLVNTGLTVLGLSLGLTGGSLVTVALGVAAAFSFHAIALSHYLIHRAFNESRRCLLAFLPEVGCGVLAVVICHFAVPLMPTAPLPSFVLKFLVVVCALLIGYVVTGQLKHLTLLIRR